MIWLTLGIILWIVAHGFKAIFPITRQKVNDKLGEEKAKAPFALGIFISFVLIIYGWRHADPTIAWYAPPEFLIAPGGLLILISIYLMASSTAGLRYRRWIRHPQLTAVAVWAGAHLLTNGEVRSVILFGGLALWSIMLMPFINRRDGAYEIPSLDSGKTEWKFILIAIVAFTILKLTHGFYTAQPLLNWFG